MRAYRQQVIVGLLAGTSLMVASTSPLAAQNVRGKLLELQSEQPIAGVTIVLVTEQNPSVSQGLTQSTQTGNDGTFALRAAMPGIYRLRAERPGYRTAITPAMELRAGDEVGLALRLLPDTVQLRPVVVTASNRRPAGRLGGFYDRMSKRIAGYFVTRDDIQKRNPLVVSDLLRTIPGLDIRPSPGAFGHDIRTVEGCRPAVFLDGLPLTLLRGESIDHLVNPMDVEGIEVYRHPTQVPVEFQRGNCGAIVIWTRTGA
jgi:carboxypeptidase family protein/TonB-dependent receptor-like protein